MYSIKTMTMALVLALTLGITGCGSSKKKANNASGTNASMESSDGSSTEFELNGDSDSGKAGSLQTVTFGFNSATLSSDARSALDNNAQILKNNDDVEVQVEGHCDERGGVQYNLALGENRARAVKQYLVSMGVSSSRISTVSFGKERPIAFGHNESAWSKNRRANFVVTSK